MWLDKVLPVPKLYTSSGQLLTVMGVDESFLMILWPGVTSSSQFSSIVETISELQCNMNYNQIVHV